MEAPPVIPESERMDKKNLELTKREIGEGKPEID